MFKCKQWIWANLRFKKKKKESEQTWNKKDYRGEVVYFWEVIDSKFQEKNTNVWKMRWPGQLYCFLFNVMTNVQSRLWQIDN